jgi:hypothetical protein
MSTRRALACLSALAALAVIGCGGGDDDDGSIHPAPEARDPGLEHIHGLGVQGDTLYIATHTGLWVAPRDQTKARRLGQSRQDVMGFSVVGKDHFIGSGHPDLTQDLPPNLGLIESRDGGRSWRSVTLLGQADFHVLESVGARVYGFDSTQGRLLVSHDGGRQWDPRTSPAPPFSLAVDPREPDRLIAATERGLFSSANAGRDWRALSVRNVMTGLVAWPAAERFYLVDGNGQVHRSADGGRRWHAVGNIAGQPAAFEAHGDELYVGLHDGTVKRSADGGRTWTLRATP